MRVTTFPLGRHFWAASDELGHRVASLLLEPSAVRERLTEGVFIPDNPEDPIAQLELALGAAVGGDAVYGKIYAAARQERITGRTPDELAARAQEQGIIAREELEALVRAKALRRAVIMVDDFPVDFGKEHAPRHDVQTQAVEAARRTA